MKVMAPLLAMRHTTSSVSSFMSETSATVASTARLSTCGQKVGRDGEKRRGGVRTTSRAEAEGGGERSGEKGRGKSSIEQSPYMCVPGERHGDGLGAEVGVEARAVGCVAVREVADGPEDLQEESGAMGGM